MIRDRRASRRISLGAGPIAALTGPFSGWRMVLMSAIVVYCAAPGMTYGIAAFVDPLTGDLGISRSLFSSAYAISTILGAVVLLLIGNQFDRWGSRRLMTLAPVGLAIGLVWLSFAQGTAWIFFGFALLRTFGQGIMPLAARILIPHWFYRQRARAYSLSVSPERSALPACRRCTSG